MRSQITSLVAVAAGRKKAELVFKNARVVNVFTGEIYETDVAVQGGYVAGLGSYAGEKELDLGGKYLSPGFIDAHLHLESAMVRPGELAKGVAVRGTTGLIADPHEIANVIGVAGLKYILEATEGLPLDIYLMLPSCVPATPFESAGARLAAEDLAPLMKHPRVLGLGELMDFESVIASGEETLEKIVLCREAEKLIDGHGPGLAGKRLNAYLAAGVRTDHETVSPEEAREKLRLGAYLLLREGTAAKNLAGLLPALTPASRGRCLFCTDDRHPQDILTEGHIDNNIRVAIRNGLEAVTAIQMATINVANCYRLERVGGIAPGYAADLVVLGDLENVEVLQVYKRGRLIAKEGRALFEAALVDEKSLRNTINFKELTLENFQLKTGDNPLRIIGLLPNSLVTEARISPVEIRDGRYYTRDGEALLKIAVIERHRATGNRGLGLVAGLGLEGGALASSVAHDSHNIVVVGDGDEDMLLAVERLRDLGGGVVLVSRGEVKREVRLPLAGLISDRPLGEVQKELASLIDACREMGVPDPFDPFMVLSFLALPVIPELKITDKGLFDVNSFRRVDINYRGN